MEMGYNQLLLDQQRTLARLSQVQVLKNESRAKFRHREEDISGLNIVKDAYQNARQVAQMKDNLRMGRTKQLSVRGKQKVHYSSDDLMRTNYQAHYEI